MSLIKYGGVNPFSGQADPLVSMSTSYDDNDGKWSRTDSYSFQGNFTGCDFESLIGRQEDLVRSFSEDFQKLEISGFDLNDKNNLVSRVSQVSFGDSDYLGAVPYNISVECTEFNREGVKDTQDSLNFSENEDQTLSVSHRVSCVGVESGDCNALQTAIDWVNTRLDISSRKPGLIPGYNLNNARLESLNEDIDRLGYSYSISRNFSVDKNSTNEPSLRYTTQTCIKEEATTISIRGNIEGGNQYSQNEVDATFDNFVQQYPYSFDSYSVDYDRKENSLGFSFSYDEDGKADNNQVLHDYSLSRTNEAEGKVTVSIDGTYQVENGKCGPTAYGDVEKRAGSQANIIEEGTALALGFFADLNDEPLSYSVTYDEKAAKISYNISFDNRPDIEEGGVTSWSADFVVPIQQVRVVPVLNSVNAAGDACSDLVIAMGYSNRATLSLNVEAPEDSTPSPKEFAERKLRELCPLTPRLTITNESTSNKDKGGVAFSYAVSFEGKPANTIEAPAVIASDLKIS